MTLTGCTGTRTGTNPPHRTASGLLTPGGGFNSCFCEETFSWVSDTALPLPRENEHKLHTAWQQDGLLTCLEREAGGGSCDGQRGFETHPREGNIRAIDIHVRSGLVLLYLQ